MKQLFFPLLALTLLLSACNPGQVVSPLPTETVSPSVPVVPSNAPTPAPICHFYRYPQTLAHPYPDVSPFSNPLGFTHPYT